jgi:hypothetical protein
VKIDSYRSDSIPEGKNYILLSGMKDINNTDLQFKEFSTHVIKILNKKGYKNVEKIDNSQLIIFMKYGIGDPSSHVFSYSVPVYGQVGGGTSTFSGNVYGSRGSSTTFGGTVTTLPTYGQVGSTTVVDSGVEYLRFLILESYDTDKYKKNGELVQVWKTNITSRGWMEDLRRIIPVMVVGSEDYIGTNTGKQIRVDMRENDSRVRTIKGQE